MKPEFPSNPLVETPSVPIPRWRRWLIIVVITVAICLVVAATFAASFQMASETLGEVGLLERALAIG